MGRGDRAPSPQGALGRGGDPRLERGSQAPRAEALRGLLTSTASAPPPPPGSEAGRPRATPTRCAPSCRLHSPSPEGSWSAPLALPIKASPQEETWDLSGSPGPCSSPQRCCPPRTSPHRRRPAGPPPRLARVVGHLQLPPAVPAPCGLDRCGQLLVLLLQLLVEVGVPQFLVVHGGSPSVCRGMKGERPSSEAPCKLLERDFLSPPQRWAPGVDLPA